MNLRLFWSQRRESQGRGITVIERKASDLDPKRLRRKSPKSFALGERSVGNQSVKNSIKNLSSDLPQNYFSCNYSKEDHVVSGGKGNFFVDQSPVVQLLEADNKSEMEEEEASQFLKPYFTPSAEKPHFYDFGLYAPEWKRDVIAENALSSNWKSDELEETRRKAFTIPWNGRILCPTLNQLKEFEGDLNLMEKMLGSRPMLPHEKNYKIRFIWNGFKFWPSYEELLLSKGDLNLLSNICSRKAPLSYQNSFRNKSLKCPVGKGIHLDF